MKNIPIAVRRAAMRFTQPAPWITILSINLPAPAEPLRICNNNEDVEFAGFVYYAFPFKMEPQKESNTSELPTVNLYVSNVAGMLMPYVEESKGGVGYTVDLMVINTDYLSEDYSALSVRYDVVSSAYDSQWAIFRLGGINLLRRKFPRSVYLKNYCRYVSEFKGVYCAYSGSDTTCAGTISACRAKGNARRFGGFLGTGGQVRVVAL